MSSLHKSTLLNWLPKHSHVSCLRRTVSIHERVAHVAKIIPSDLTRLNQHFLSSYQVKKNEIRKTLGDTIPVLIMNGDELLFLYENKRTTACYVPYTYHGIKDIAHVACALHTLVWLNKQGLSIQSEKERILTLLHKTAKMMNSVETPPEVFKYSDVLHKYLNILNSQPVEEIIPQLSSLKPVFQDMIVDAARIRTESLHQHVNALKAGIPSSAWDRLGVIVMGPHMPREGELAVQYAKKMILGETDFSEQCPHLNNSLTNTTHVMKGKRLLYAESVEDIEKALMLLATDICDGQLGASLLNDAQIMRSDLLSKAVQTHLKTMTPNQKI